MQAAGAGLFLLWGEEPDTGNKIVCHVHGMCLLVSYGGPVCLFVRSCGTVTLEHHLIWCLPPSFSSKQILNSNLLDSSLSISLSLSLSLCELLQSIPFFSKAPFSTQSGVFLIEGYQQPAHVSAAVDKRYTHCGCL